MTPKQRLLKALKHEIPDRVPWSLLVNKYFLDVLPEEYRKLDPTQFLKHFYADGLSWLGFSSSGRNVNVKIYIDGKLYKTQEGGNWFSEFYDYLFNIDYYWGDDGRTVTREYITPVGTIKTECVYKENSQTVFISEYPLKTVDDFKIFSYMIDDLEYEYDAEYVNKELKTIGDDGIGALMLHASPAYELIWCFTGLENFHYLLFDHKKETTELLERMAQKYYTCYEMYVKNAPVPAVILPEDAGTTLYSPGIFDEHIKPALSRYCEIIHKYDKIPVMHACGHLRDLLKSIDETGVECIESMSPPPTGNITVRDVKKTLPGMCVMGGIPATVFTEDLDSFRSYVGGLIQKNKTGKNFILSSGDSVPADARLDNIKAIPDLIEQFGKY
jgi:hypothetical protein